MFQFRRFPSYTYGFSAWYMSFTHVDCSIRKSMDRCPLTAPHSLSQLVASFFGSQCQGIPLALFVAWPCVLLGSQKLVSLQRLALWNCRFRFLNVFTFSSLYLLSLYSVFNVHWFALANLGGDERNRTDDPLLAKQVLSQLSYTPIFNLNKRHIRCVRPYSPEVPFYRALKIKQRLTSQTIS